MACPPQVPISILPPVSQGPSPILWQNGNQITRLNTPLNASWLVYDGTTTRWGDGSAQAPIYLPNIQEVNNATVAYVAGITTTGQIVKTLGASGTSIIGGQAGEVIYQSAPSVTSFTAQGTTGQVLSSNGTSAPSWLSQSSLSVGTAVNATNATNATNAVTATKLATPRTIGLSGDVTGTASFDGSANATIAATVPNNTITAAKLGTNVQKQICKAWVNFDGTTATPSTIRSSYNVSSITKNGTGNYSINLVAGAVADANYSTNVSSNAYTAVLTANTTSYAQVLTYNPSAVLYNAGIVGVVIFGN